MMPVSHYCEGLFSRICNRYSGGETVYTEDVGGSSPSSPTNNFNDLHRKCKWFDGIVEPMGAAMMQPAYDFEYADAIRWAQSHGLEIHVTRKGDVWTCRRGKKRSRITGEVRYAPTLSPVPPKEI